MAVADEAGQPDRAAVAQGHAPAPAVDAEDGVGGRHPQVAPDGQLQPAGHGVALDGGDDRLVEQHPGRPHRPVAVDGRPGCPGPSATPFRSAPAQKVPSAPVSTATRASSSASKRAEGVGQLRPRWGRRRRCAPSGRSMVTTATAPSASKWMVMERRVGPTGCRRTGRSGGLDGVAAVLTRTQGGILAMDSRRASTSSKPAAGMAWSVVRVRWQLPAHRFHRGSMRCCQRWRLGFSTAAMCSRKTKSPPGRRTRWISASAASWSGTEQRTRVDTTTSKLPSANGMGSTPASAISIGNGAEPGLGLRGQLGPHEPVRLGQDEAGHRGRVVLQVQPGPRTDLEHLTGHAARRAARQSRRPAASVLANDRSYHAAMSRGTPGL